MPRRRGDDDHIHADGDDDRGTSLNKGHYASRNMSLLYSTIAYRPVAMLVAIAGTWYAARTIGYSCTVPPLPAGYHTPTSRAVRGPQLQIDAATALASYSTTAKAASFHHVSLCSRPHPKFALLQETAAWHGNAVIPLGMGDKRFQRWGFGFGVKLLHVQDYVRNVAPDTIVMFTDAFDVLLMASHDGIRDAYLAAIEVAMAREANDPALPRGHTPRVPTIIFSTEYYCWPDAARAPEYPVDDRRFEFAFLNSGSCIAKAL